MSRSRTERAMKDHFIRTSRLPRIVARERAGMIIAIVGWHVRERRGTDWTQNRSDFIESITTRMNYVSSLALCTYYCLLHPTEVMLWISDEASKDGRTEILSTICCISLLTAIAGRTRILFSSCTAPSLLGCGFSPMWSRKQE
jgi:hypothetical protein